MNLFVSDILFYLLILAISIPCLWITGKDINEKDEIEKKEP